MPEGLNACLELRKLANKLQCGYVELAISGPEIPETMKLIDILTPQNPDNILRKLERRLFKRVNYVDFGNSGTELEYLQNQPYNRSEDETGLSLEAISALKTPLANNDIITPDLMIRDSAVGSQITYSGLSSVWRYTPAPLPS